MLAKCFSRLPFQIGRSRSTTNHTPTAAGRSCWKSRYFSEDHSYKFDYSCCRGDSRTSDFIEYKGIKKPAVSLTIGFPIAHRRFLSITVGQWPTAGGPLIERPDRPFAPANDAILSRIYFLRAELQVLHGQDNT